VQIRNNAGSIFLLAAALLLLCLHSSCSDTRTRCNGSPKHFFYMDASVPTWASELPVVHDGDTLYSFLSADPLAEVIFQGAIAPRIRCLIIGDAEIVAHGSLCQRRVMGSDSVSYTFGLDFFGMFHIVTAHPETVTVSGLSVRFCCDDWNDGGCRVEVGCSEWSPPVSFTIIDTIWRE
jgi:hypothetical protein